MRTTGTEHDESSSITKRDKEDIAKINTFKSLSTNYEIILEIQFIAITQQTIQMSNDERTDIHLCVCLFSRAVVIIITIIAAAVVVCSTAIHKINAENTL